MMMPKRRLMPLNWVQWLTLALGIVGTIAFLILYTRQQNELRSINRALCLTKADKEKALVSAHVYLMQHPNGTPDFSRAFIIQAIHDDAVSLQNLADVRCAPSETQH